MFNSPYKTPAFAKFNFDKIASTIRRLEIDERLVSLDSKNGILAVPRDVTEIPPFSLFITQDESPNMHAKVVVDGRTFLKEDNTVAKPDIHNFYLNAARLINVWRHEGKGDIKDVGGDFLIKTYGQWMRNALTRRLNLDLAHTYLVQAVMTIFFIQLQSPLTDNSSGADVDRIINRAARCLPATDPIRLMEILGDEVRPLTDLKSAITWIREISTTPRMEGLTIELARVSVNAAWPAQYREVSTAAAEFPPLFMMMVYQSIRSNSFIRTELGELLKRNAKAVEATQFMKSVDRLLNP